LPALSLPGVVDLVSGKIDDAADVVAVAEGGVRGVRDRFELTRRAGNLEPKALLALQIVVGNV
jgi:hypothetical protein